MILVYMLSSKFVLYCAFVIVGMGCIIKRFDCILLQTHCQTSNIKQIIVGNRIVDNLDVVGAVPVGCSNYIFILDLTHAFNGLGKDNCKTRWETFKFWDLVWLILQVWQWASWVQLPCALWNKFSFKSSQSFLLELYILIHGTRDVTTVH